MRKNYSKIVCIKLVHLPYLYVYDARSHLHQKGTHDIEWQFYQLQLVWKGEGVC